MRTSSAEQRFTRGFVSLLFVCLLLLPDLFAQEPGRNPAQQEQKKVGVGSSTKPVELQPAINFSTFLGGSAEDAITGVAIDTLGRIYVTGWTRSSNFAFLSPSRGVQPVNAGPFQPCAPGQDLRCGGDVFVARLSADGSTLDYATFLGGSGIEYATGIAVDSMFRAVVVGVTESRNFPTTPNAMKSQFPAKALKQGFLAVVDSTGSVLLNSTLAGGSKNSELNAVALDSSGNAFVAGTTLDADFQVTSGANQTSCKSLALQPSQPCAFIAELLAPDYTSIAYQTLHGGSNGSTKASGIAVDRSEAVYVTGTTTASDFPTTLSAVQGTYGGNGDAFVTKFSKTGALVYSTFLGGSGTETGQAIAVDLSGRAYITGGTNTDNATAAHKFPITAGVVQPNYNGGTSNCLATGIACGDAFVTGISASGTSLLFSTYFGGSGDDVGLSIGLDAANNIHIAGSTNSQDLAVTPKAFQGRFAGGTVPAKCLAGTFCGDGFVLSLNGMANLARTATYLGGSGDDAGTAVAVSPKDGSVVAAGTTASSTFPTGRPNPAIPVLQSSLGGISNGFVVQLAPAGLPACTLTWVGAQNAPPASWNTPGNWSNGTTTGFLPGPADKACLGGAQLIIDTTLPVANQIIGSVDAQGGGTLTISSGTSFTITDSLGQANLNNLVFNNATLNIANLQVAGTFQFTGGTITMSDSFAIQGLTTCQGGNLNGPNNGSSSLIVTGGMNLTGVLNVDTVSLLNGGPTTMSGPATQINLTNGAFAGNSRASSTWDVMDSAGIIAGAGGSSGFTNFGTLTKSVGGTTTIDVAVENEGPLNVNAGTLVLSGGANSDVGGSMNVAAGASLQVGGKTVSFTNQNFTGAGTVIWNPTTTAFAGGGTYQVTGTTTFNSGSTFFGTATGPETITNMGTMTINGASVTFGGTAATPTTIAASAIGPLTMNGGTLNFSSAQAGGVTLSSNVTLQGGATVTGSDNLTFALSAALSWGNSTISLTGQAFLDGPTTLTGTTGPNLVGTKMSSTDAVTMNSPFTLQSGAIFTNQGGAKFTVANDSSINASGAPATTFNNAGTFTKSGGTAAAGTSIAPVFNNSGTVFVNSGGAQLLGGGNFTGPATVATGTKLAFGAGTFSVTSMLTGPGAYEIDAATLNFNAGAASPVGANAPALTLLNPGIANVAAGVTLNLNLLKMSGGTLNGPATAVVTAGQASWGGGTIAGAGTLNLTGLSSFTNNLADNGWTINNSGLLSQSGSGSTLRVNGNAVLNNLAAGTWDFGDFVSVGDPAGVNLSTFNNSGKLTKSLAGPGTLILSTQFDNQAGGNFLIQAGATSLEGTTNCGPSCGGNYNVAAGAQLLFSLGSYLISGAISGAGSVTVQGTGVTAQSSVQLLAAGVGTNLATLTIGSFGSVEEDAVATLSNVNLVGGGKLLGQGTMTGAITNTSGTVHPGGANGFGILTLTGNYSQAVGGTFAMNLGGLVAGTYSQLVVSGTANVSGTITGSGVFAYVVGNQITPIATPGASGSFSTNTLMAPPQQFWNIANTPAGVVATLAAAAQLTLGPSPVPFGNQRVNSPGVAVTVTLTNPTTAAVTLANANALQITGSNAADFATTTGTTCANNTIVPPTNGTCVIKIIFTPGAAGPRTATLTVTGNGNPASVSVTLNGTGTAPIANAAPAQLVFGNQPKGVTSTQMTVTVSNTGSDVLHLAAANAVTLSGANAGDFAVVAATTTCTNGVTVIASGSCVIELTFTPATTAGEVATLTITDDSGAVTGSTQNVALSGTGTGSGTPTATLSANTLAFGNQGVGAPSASQTITITNNGGAALVLAAANAVTVTGTNAGDYTLASGTTCTNGASVASSGGTCVIIVIFTPGATGTRGPATVTITDNANPTTQTATLTGTGIDFTLTVASAAITVTAGNPAIYTINVAPGANGYASAISFAASGAPSATTLTFTPPTLTPNGTATSTMLTITTTKNGAVLPPGPIRGPSLRLLQPILRLWIAALLAVMMAAFFALPNAWVRRCKVILPLLLFIVGAMVLGGCASGGQNVPAQGTPRGTSTITVTATSGSLVHTTKLTLTVN
jgi:Beta-propeller repeat